MAKTKLYAYSTSSLYCILQPLGPLTDKSKLGAGVIIKKSPSKLIIRQLEVWSISVLTYAHDIYGNKINIY